MRTKKMKAAICLVLFILVNNFFMNAVLASQPTENWEHNVREDGTTATTQKNYLITETTSIKNDFYYLGIEREKYENLTDLLHSTVVAMLYLDSSLYLYMAMPEDTDYQVSYIIINDRKYENTMRPLAVENNYHKYAFQGFKENSKGEYLITEIGFEHPDGGKLVYDAKCTCEMGIRDGHYYFKQSCVNHVVLEGEFIEDQYQFENSSDFKNVSADLFNKTDLKDTDERSFYYFAFNCYDPQIEHYFTPDEITEIVVEYTINRYIFAGKIRDYKKARLVEKEQRIQTITQERIQVEANDKWDSNHHPYEYNTIYKLSNVELTDNDELTNHKTLYAAKQDGFEWVIHFGSPTGYRYAENYARSKCDIDFTDIEDFSTIKMTYEYNGKKEVDVPTGMLVDPTPKTIREKNNTESILTQLLHKVDLTIELTMKIIARTFDAMVNFTKNSFTNFWNVLHFWSRVILIGIVVIVLYKKLPVVKRTIVPAIKKAFSKMSAAIKS